MSLRSSASSTKSSGRVGDPERPGMAKPLWGAFCTLCLWDRFLALVGGAGEEGTECERKKERVSHWEK